MTAQTFTSPSGDEMVILPRAEYEALVAAAQTRDEDADDVAIYDARKAELAAGGNARLPREVSEFILRGDSLLKALRKWRGMTQLHLADRTNFGQGYLSDLETGRRKGSPETLKSIAEALDIPFEWISD